MGNIKFLATHFRSAIDIALTEGKFAKDFSFHNFPHACCGDKFKHDSTFLNYSIPVYVGYEDEFHKLFEVEDRDVHENVGLSALGVCVYRG